jgi:hypothetical protein
MNVTLNSSTLNTSTHVPASVVLQELLDEMPPETFTLSWVLGRLPKHSFGILMLLLALIGVAPGISLLSGLLLGILALQMIAGWRSPAFPRRIAAHPLPARHLANLLQRAIPALKYLERAVHPRWSTPAAATQRVVGIVVLLLSLVLLLFPVPFSSILPALVIVAIAFAYLQDDGILLAVASMAAVVMLGLMGAAVWQAIVGAVWLVRFW